MCHSNTLFAVPASPLHSQMLRSHTAAYADGTQKNRDRQAATFIKFCLQNDYSYLYPSLVQTCCFIQHLANIMSAPATVRNYISGVKSWLVAHGGDPAPFNSPEAQAVTKGAARLSSHIPSKAPALTPQDIMCIADYLDKAGPNGLVLKTALLLTYFTFLRRSNVLAPSLTTWAGPHTLRRGDVVPRPHGLTVIVRSSKTISKPGQAVALIINRVPASSYCPVTTWELYCERFPGPSDGPAFMLPGTRPLTAPPLVGVMRTALGRAGRPYAPCASMHSLRRGAALAAADRGCPLEDLCHHGTWSGPSGIAPYVPPERITSVPGRLAAAFAP